MEELKQSVKNEILEALRARRHWLRITAEEERLIDEHLELVPVERTEVATVVDKCLELFPVIDGDPTLPEGTTFEWIVNDLRAMGHEVSQTDMEF